MFTTPDKVAPTVTVHGKRYERESITHTFTAASDHFLPVLGLYEDFANKVTVSLPNGDSITLTIQTGKLPSDICRCLNIQASARLSRRQHHAGRQKFFLPPMTIKAISAGCSPRTPCCDIKRMQDGNVVTGSEPFLPHALQLHRPDRDQPARQNHKEYRMPGRPPPRTT